MPLQQCSYRIKQAPSGCQHRALRPVQLAVELPQAQQFVNHGYRLAVFVGGDELLHPAFADGVQFLPTPSGIQDFSAPIYANRLLLLHPILIVLNQLVGGGDDVRAGTVIFHQVMHLGLVIVFKLANKTDISATKLVDILVVITYRQDAQLTVIILGAPGDGRNQLVLLGINILVFIDQDKAVTRQ